MINSLKTVWDYLAGKWNKLKERFSKKKEPEPAPSSSTDQYFIPMPSTWDGERGRILHITTPRGTFKTPGGDSPIDAFFLGVLSRNAFDLMGDSSDSEKKSGVVHTGGAYADPSEGNFSGAGGSGGWFTEYSPSILVSTSSSDCDSSSSSSSDSTSCDSSSSFDSSDYSSSDSSSSSGSDW
jgi:hypothetical protein